MGNSFFKKKGVSKSTWIRVANERVIKSINGLYVDNKENGW